MRCEISGSASNMFSTVSAAVEESPVLCFSDVSDGEFVLPIPLTKASPGTTLSSTRSRTRPSSSMRYRKTVIASFCIQLLQNETASASLLPVSKKICAARRSESRAEEAATSRKGRMALSILSNCFSTASSVAMAASRAAKSSAPACMSCQCSSVS